MITALLLTGVLLALVASAFFSGCETGVYSLDRVRLRVRAEEDGGQARRLERLMARQEELVITTLLGTNIADYLATAFVSALLLHTAFSQSQAEVYTTAILTPLVLVFGGVIPKDWFQRESDRLMYGLSLPLAICHRAARCTGLVFLLRTLTDALIRRLDPLAKREHELAPRLRVSRLLQEGALSGGLTAFQREAMDRLLRLSQVRVGAVMTPRPRAIMVPRDVQRDDLLRVARMAHFSRLPVYEGDPRRVIGTLNVYDVLMDEQPREPTSYLREPVFVLATETVPAALLKLQQGRQVMAIVLDERRQCVGLLTIKDLIEEIVGELQPA